MFLDADKNGDLYLDESEGIKLGLTFTQMGQIDALDTKDGRISPQEYLEFKKLYYEPVKWRSVVSAGQAMLFADGKPWRFTVAYLLKEKGLSENNVEQILGVLDKVNDPAKRDEIAGHIIKIAEENGDYSIFDRISGVEIDEEAFLNGVRLFTNAIESGEVNDGARARFFRYISDMDTLWRGLEKNHAVLKEKGFNEAQCGEYRKDMMEGVDSYAKQEAYEALGVAGTMQHVVFYAATWYTVNEPGNEPGPDTNETNEPANLFQTFKDAGIPEETCKKLSERYESYFTKWNREELSGKLANIVAMLNDAKMTPMNKASFLFGLAGSFGREGTRGGAYINTNVDPAELDHPQNAKLFNAVIDNMSSVIDVLKKDYGVSEGELYSTLVKIVPQASISKPFSDPTALLDVGSFLATAKSWGWSLGDVIDFHKVIRQLGMNEGEIYQMLSNSDVKKKYTPEGLLNLLVNAANKGHVTHFGRLSLKVLEAIAQPRRANRPLAVVSMANHDWNGAFYDLYDDIEDFIDQGYDVDLREVTVENDICDQFADAGKADAWLLAGHGSPKIIQLGNYTGKDDETRTFDTSDAEAAEKIRPHLSKDAKIVFAACSTAASPDDGTDPLALTMAKRLGRPIWANMLDGIIYCYKFDDEGEIDRVVYVGTELNGNRKDDSGTLAMPE